MPTRLVHLVVDATEPARLARFWAGALGWEVVDEAPDEVDVCPPGFSYPDPSALPLVFVPLPEIVDRYLAGETIEIIAKNLNARGVPAPVYKGAAGKEWYPRTIAKMLRSASISGRRMDNYGKPESERKTILRYKGIITWQTHLELVKKLDSKAHRKGISPANVYMLSGILTDELGRRMRGHVSRGGRRKQPYFYYYVPGLMIRMDQADKEIEEQVADLYGELPYLEQRIIPGATQQLMSQGFPIMEYYRGLAELPKRVGALMAESKGGESK